MAIIVLTSLGFLYFLGICALEYYVLVAFSGEWQLTLSSKIFLVFLGTGGLSFLIGGIGLLKLKKWARRLILVTAWVYVAYSLFSLGLFVREYGGTLKDYVYGALTTAFYALFVFVLMRPGIKSKFK